MIVIINMRIVRAFSVKHYQPFKKFPLLFIMSSFRQTQISTFSVPDIPSLILIEIGYVEVTTPKVRFPT